MDVVAVMNGDGQMDPDILDRIVDPVATGEADYAKGNRLLSREDREGMSTFRFVGNAMLTGLEVCLGLLTVGDPRTATPLSRGRRSNDSTSSRSPTSTAFNHILTHLNLEVSCRRRLDVGGLRQRGEQYPIRAVRPLRFAFVAPEFPLAAQTPVRPRGFHPAVVFYGAGSSGLAVGVLGVVGSLGRSLRGSDGFTGALVSFVAF